MRAFVPSACVCLLLLSGCQQDPSARNPDTAAAPATESAQAEPEAGNARPDEAHGRASVAGAGRAGADTAKSIMDYSCEGGHNVAIIDGGAVARVALGDGRVIDLPRSADQTPPLYAGEALEFAVTSNGGMLGQDEVGGSSCEAAV